MATSFSYSITLITVRRAMTTGSPLMSIIVLNSLVSIVGLTTALVLGTLASTNMRALGWFALTGVAGHGTGSLIFFSAIERLGVNRATAVHSSAPLWAWYSRSSSWASSRAVYVLMGDARDRGRRFSALLAGEKARGRAGLRTGAGRITSCRFSLLCAMRWFRCSPSWSRRAALSGIRRGVRLRPFAHAGGEAHDARRRG